MAITKVYAKVNNGEEIELLYNDSTGKYEAKVTAPNISTNSSEVPDGYLPVYIRAEDDATNFTEIDINDSEFGKDLKLYIREEKAPTIEVSSPTPGAYDTNETQTIIFDVVDDKNGMTSGYSGVDKSSIIIKIDGTPISGVSYSDIPGGYRGTYTSAIEDGNHIITIDAKDRDNNSAVTKTVAFTVDRVKPNLIDVKINGSSDEIYVTNEKQLTITGKTTDVTSKPVTVSISVNSVDQGAVTVNDDGTFTKNITLGNDGSYTIVIKATDKATNFSTATRTVNLNTIGPKFISVSITPGNPLDNPASACGQYTIAVEVE